MMLRLLLLMLVSSGAVFAQGFGQLTVSCGPYSSLIASLKANHHEALVVRAPVNSGDLMEVWSSPGGATWTSLHRSATGRACLLGAGTNYEAFPLPTQTGTDT